MKTMDKIVAFFTLATIATYPAVTSAAGFALLEQGVKDLGNAYAGGAAGAEDASTIYYNPAGMTRLPAGEIAVAGHLIEPSARFSDGGSRFRTVALTGDQGGDAGTAALVPNFYYESNLGRDMKIGLGINVPFGLTSEYDSNWKGRYQAIKSDLETVNINPSIAYKALPNLSIGAGISAQYAKAELTNAVDLRALVFGTTQQDADAKASVTGNDWGYGFNAGLLYEFSDTGRLGFAYRSQVAHTLKGNATFAPTNATAGALLPLVQATGNLVNTTARAKTKLPESASLSGWQQLNSAWTVMADATWTRWSRLQEIRIHFDSSQPDSVTPQNWRDTWRYALGAIWTPGGAWTYRTGIAYDETPVPDAQHRSPRIPENTHRWLTLGASFQSTKTLAFDMAYAHVFEKRADINNTDPLGHQLLGTFDLAVNIVSAQLNWTFY